MQSARRKSTPPLKADSRETIRPSRLLPFAMVAVVVAVAIILLVMGLGKPRAKIVDRTETAAAVEPAAPSHFERGAIPAQAPIFVPHIVEPTGTETVLSEQGPNCLSCAKENGCLDPKAEGGSCEDVPGEATGCGAGVTERDICYKTLKDVFTSKCAESLQETPCLCGTTDVVGCLDGTARPTGPVFPDYACDFKTTDVTVIDRDFREGTYGVGRANTLIQCVAGYSCGCFGK